MKNNPPIAEAAAAPLLSFRRLQKSFDGRRVLDVGAFALFPGECGLIAGANGAGKTTLLKIIAGLLAPDADPDLIFAGRRRDRRRPPKDAVYLHQSPYLFTGDVRANIGYGLRRRAIAAADADARINAAMRWAGVAHLAGRRAQTLSGGEARRVALARVFAVAPRLYLLDEPTVHLDDAGAAAVRGLIGDLAGRGAAMLISSHDRDLRDLSARRFLLRDGKLHPADG